MNTNFSTSSATAPKRNTPDVSLDDTLYARSRNVSAVPPRNASAISSFSAAAVPPRNASAISSFSAAAVPPSIISNSPRKSAIDKKTTKKTPQAHLQSLPSSPQRGNDLAGYATAQSIQAEKYSSLSNPESSNENSLKLSSRERKEAKEAILKLLQVSDIQEYLIEKNINHILLTIKDCFASNHASVVEVINLINQSSREIKEVLADTVFNILETRVTHQPHAGAEPQKLSVIQVSQGSTADYLFRAFINVMKYNGREDLVSINDSAVKKLVANSEFASFFLEKTRIPRDKLVAVADPEKIKLISHDELTEIRNSLTNAFHNYTDILKMYATHISTHPQDLKVNINNSHRVTPQQISNVQIDYLAEIIFYLYKGKLNKEVLTEFLKNNESFLTEVMNVILYDVTGSTNNTIDEKTYSKFGLISFRERENIKQKIDYVFIAYGISY